MPNPVVHFEVVGPDGPALQRFYADVFGWKIDADNPLRYGMVDTGVDHSVRGGIGATDDGRPGHATFYVAVDDPGAYLERIEAAGGRTMVPVTEIPDMVTFALFADPQGNQVGLVKAQG